MDNQNKIYIITSNIEAGALETLPVTSSMELIANNDLLQTDLLFNEHKKICVTSEYSLETVYSKLNIARRTAIDVLKDKFKFREILASLYPDYQFKLINVNEIKNLKIDRKSVIKPVRGCFATAVRVIEPNTNFEILSSELQAELVKNSKVYSNYTLSKDDFILEQYIGGKEYAIDMFYNSNGEPCILNLFHHPIPQNEAYLHMAYNTSKVVFDEIYSKAKVFLRELNTLLKVKNFVMHVEVKVENDVLFPIEINSMRIGGMGLGNLAYYALGINPYTYILNDCEPDWEHIWEGKEQAVYTFFIAYNGINKPVDQFKPNYAKLKKKFTRVIHEQPFDYQKQLAFGIYFLEETAENILKLLHLEFDDFFDEL
jgi:hypothetical protein